MRSTNPRIRRWIVPPAALAWMLAPAIALPAYGDGEVLTLERAIAIALDNNRELAAAAAGLGAAAARLDEARAQRLPRLELAAVVQRTDNPVLVFSNLLGQGDFQEQNFALDNLNEPDPLSHWKTRLSVTQPLWTAGRIGHAVAAAEHLESAGGGAREAARQHVVHAVIESYTAAILAGRELEVARQALETARAHVRLVHDLWQGGLVVESDALQAEVRESEVQELEIRAASAVEVSRAALNLAMGRALPTPITLPADVELEAAAEAAPDWQQAVATALENRPDLRAARERVEAAARRVAGERAGRLPEVGLEGSWEANAADFFGADGDNWALTVGLRVDLFDGWRRRARVRQADQERLEAQARTDFLAESIGLEIRRAGSELASSRQRLDQTERGVALAERSLAIIADRYREGLTVLTELLDAESALTRARLRHVAARRDVLLARAGLDLAMGEL